MCECQSPDRVAGRINWPIIKSSANAFLSGGLKYGCVNILNAFLIWPVQRNHVYRRTSDGKFWFVIVCCNHFSRDNKVWLLPAQYHPWRCCFVGSKLLLLLKHLVEIQLVPHVIHNGSISSYSIVSVLLIFLLFLKILFHMFSFPQVAQWPEKEEKEQPMFGEEYDW